MPDRLTARQILDRLVAFPTVSRTSNLELVAWVEDYLRGWGVTPHRVADPTGRKATVFASIGPEVAGGIALSGHTDVVPVDGQVWSSDPWTVTERDGRLYGRGTCDMKGFDALALAAVPLALDKGAALKRPLQIFLTHDEEIGCLAPPQVIPDIRATIPQAAACIVGEPSMMKCVTGHKGATGFQVSVHGVEVHSSMMDRGVSAILEAARIIDYVNTLNDRIRAARPSAIAAQFDPPFTTVHCGHVQGGTAHNITAGLCEFGFDFRVLPDEDIEDWKQAFRDRVAEVEAGMKAVRPEARIDYVERFDIPGLRPETDGAAEAITRAITGDNGNHVVSYGTEAGQFQAGGWSAVVCGPGDIAQAHQPDEYLTVAQFKVGERFVAGIVDKLCE